MVIILMMCSSRGDGDNVGDDADDCDNVGDDAGDDAGHEMTVVIHQCSPRICQEPPTASKKLPSLPRACL